ncbi:MAG TPA: RNA polymerase sigma-54 factor, partial [bacterium]|nr:RNA polymerase sigma-54 factor [bacterium]
ARISRQFGVQLAWVEQAHARLKQLQLYPASGFDSESPQYIVSDVIVRKLNHQYEVVVNDEHLPSLRISSRYRQIYQDQGTGKETRDYLRKKFEDAEWVIRSIHQRNQTIYRVAKTLVNLQYDFIEQGFDQLKPLTLRDVAERIGMSESTVSRVTSNKYMQIPRGIFRMRVLFSGEIPSGSGGPTSARAVQTQLRTMIEQEDPLRPLTDSAIHRQMVQAGLQIARRTVCKYREELGILPAKLRRKKR